LPTSSDVRDYCRDLPTVAPQYLREWAEKRGWKQHALLFKMAWVKDPITGIKSKAAECICTCCGAKTWEGWVGAGCHNGRNGIWIGTRAVGEWDETVCQECGAKVVARHLNGGDNYADEEAWPLTLHRIPEPGKADRLVMIIWKVDKYFDRGGRRHITINPWEAYVAEEKTMRRCTKHGGYYYSYWIHEWQQVRGFSEGLQAIREIVCPEGIETAVEGTTCENAKLEIYMSSGGIVFPAAWVRLWQMRPRAETLLTCGAGNIVDNLIGQEKTENTGYRCRYNFRIPRLRELNWKAQRPWEILRMHGKDELREAVEMQKEKNLGGKTWKMWLKAREAGKPWTLEDAAALEAMKSPERIADTEIRPAKALRYLDAQRRRWPEDKADEILLTDYWAMAAEGYDLNDPDLLWPDRLKREHDRLAAKQKREANAARDAKIEAQARKLEQFAMTMDGITIRPARSAGELEAEGKCLHHCVGSYAERVAKGETYIFFIRREAEPDMSWFTLNLDKAKRNVIQNRGSRNCDRTPEVQAFEDAWIAWVRAGAQRDKNGEPVIPGIHKKEDVA